MKILRGNDQDIPKDTQPKDIPKNPKKNQPRGTPKDVPKYT